MIDVNLLGAWRVTAAAIDHLVESRGRVVLLGSRMSFIGLPLGAAYGVSKRALTAYADALRAEYGTHVKVTCVHPAFVRTPIHDRTREAGLQLEGFSHEEPIEQVVATIVSACEEQAPRPRRGGHARRRAPDGRRPPPAAPRRPRGGADAGEADRRRRARRGRHRGGTPRAPQTRVATVRRVIRALPLALASLALLVLPATAATGNPWLDERTFINMAHQGGEDEFPSNTMYAFKESLAGGADTLELDVNRTKDDQFVVMHDWKVDRTTNGTGYTTDMTLAEIQAAGRRLQLHPGPERGGRPARLGVSLPRRPDRREAAARRLHAPRTSACRRWPRCSMRSRTRRSTSRSRARRTRSPSSSAMPSCWRTL